jgi:flagellar biosynthesis/type III secretory pathway protein FliH
MESEIKQVIFEEFGDAQEIVRIGERTIDITDDQYSIPKIQNKLRKTREVNRFDGQKIYVGNSGLDDFVLEEKEFSLRHETINPDINKVLITPWKMDDLVSSVENEAKNSFSDHKQPDFDNLQSIVRTENDIQEAKGIAKEIIENAKKEAQKILDSANEEGKSITDKGYHDGYQFGFAQVNSEIEILRTVQKEMQQLNTEIIQDSEEKVVELVKLITEKLFVNGLALDANILKDIVARAISEASRLGNLKVYLNPDDLNKLKKLWRETELDYNGQKIQLASNNEVLPGGCFIEGEFGSVDARIKTKLERVIDTIVEIQLDKTEE